MKKTVKKAQRGIKAASDNTRVKSPVVKKQPARTIAGIEAMKDFNRSDSARRTPISTSFDQYARTIDSLFDSGSKKSKAAGGMPAILKTDQYDRRDSVDYIEARDEAYRAAEKIKKLPASKKKMGGKVTKAKVLAKSVTKVVKKSAKKK
jgi:hypothetical protein